MPTAGSHFGKKYVPTPVDHQTLRQNTLPDSHNDNYFNGSASPIVSQTPPPQMDNNLSSPKHKTRLQSKTTSSKKKCSTKKKVIVGCIIAAIIIAIIVAVILLAVLLSRKSDATTTTTTQSSYNIAYWSFDATTSELYNNYNGTLINSPSYFSQTINQPYVGYGRGLSLTSTSSQYFIASSPFLDLTYKSFTIEAWIYPSISSSSTDYGIFGQCQCSSCSYQCLAFAIRTSRLFISFLNSDLSGNTTLSSNTWYHIAFVYNYDTKQQILYVNGVQDAIKSSASAYQGTNGSLLIGASQIYLTTNYFNGYIDNFKITTTAKPATEILNAGTLTAYFSFDAPNPSYDSGPLGLNGTMNNTAIVSGHVNQAMRFSGSSSYFYAYGFYQAGYGVYSGKSFSVSLWINPSIYGGATIVQFAYSLSIYACQNLLGLFSNYGPTMQIVAQGTSYPTIYGPFAYINTWTHITVTYSYSNGLRLYVNGAYYGATGSFTFSNTGYILYLQLGYAYYCSSSSVPNAGYQGMVDEVYVHSREISQSEVSTLASV